MTARLTALCIDANDPLNLARFWAAALRWDIDTSTDPISVTPTDGTPLYIDFALVPEPRPAGQSRIHLDLTTESADDQRDTVGLLLGLGASRLNVGQTSDEGHVVLADPEGNELCIIEPDNQFLSSCGRLGAINCDGSYSVGVFWSELLGWPLIWDQDEETAIRAPGPTGPIIAWGGPPVMPKAGDKNRLHLDLAPADGRTQVEEVERAISLGARRVDIGQGDVDWVVMADPDDNEFCILATESNAVRRRAQRAPSPDGT